LAEQHVLHSAIATVSEPLEEDLKKEIASEKIPIQGCAASSRTSRWRSAIAGRTRTRLRIGVTHATREVNAGLALRALAFLSCCGRNALI
jgi:hypothetical protein